MDKKIMIIDDMPLNVKLLKEILEDEGYRVYHISDNIKDLAIDAICETMPSVVFLDIMMPGINGYELCNRIKEHSFISSIPVIMLSAMAEGDCC